MKGQTNTSAVTRKLVLCAMLVAIAAVLSIFPKFKFLPYGGSITVCSMLPIVLASYICGTGWGFLSAFVFALIQTLTGFTSAGAVSIWSTIGVVAFDYMVAFTILGIGGIFRGKLGSTTKELVWGSILALVLRLASHTLAGFLFYKDYAEWFFSEAGEFGAQVLEKVSGNALYLLYSFLYNASYMVPEIIITAIAAGIVAKFLPRLVKQA